MLNVLTPYFSLADCTYVAWDGQFNPDAQLVNDVGAFQDLSEVVFYNTIT